MYLNVSKYQFTNIAVTNIFEFEYLFTCWVESQQTVDTSSKKVSCLADSENQFFFKIAFFCQLPILFKCNFFNYNVLLWRYYNLYKECNKLHASRAFVHYVPYVLSCNCFVRIFLFLRAFNFLRALRAVTFYVPYLTSFFTCFKCLHFFCMSYVPLFFTCLIKCLHYMFDVPYVLSLFYKIWSNPQSTFASWNEHKRGRINQK